MCGLLSFDYEESEILKLDDLEKIETQISLSWKLYFIVKI